MRIAVEDLRVGDHVRTLDSGFQPHTLDCIKTLDSIDLALRPKLRPIRVKAGALGPAIVSPTGDLVLSPQHRVLIRSSVVRRMFAEDDVLVAANKLLAVDGVERPNGEPRKGHILSYPVLTITRSFFQTVRPRKAYFWSTQTLNTLTPEARAEIETLFPALASAGTQSCSARTIPDKGRKIRSLLARHARNGQALQRCFWRDSTATLD